MSTIRWSGNAASLAQVTTWTFGGTWLATEHVTFTINGKAVISLTGSTAILTILANLTAFFATLDQTLYPEFVPEITVTNDGATKLIATGVTPGTIFTMALSTDSVSGTIGAASTTTAATGPNHWDTAANWIGGVLPAAADDVVIDIPFSIDTGLAQSAIVLTSLTISAPGQLGRPEQNPGGYFDYRPTYMAIGATTITFNGTVASDSCFFRIDPGAHATTINVNAMGNAPNGSSYALQIKGGGGSSYTINAEQGVIGVSVEAGETSTVTNARSGYISNINGDVTMVFGVGCTLGTITQLGGSVTVNSTPTTWNIAAGTATFLGTAGATTLTAVPADGQQVVINYESAGGTIGTLTLGAATLSTKTFGTKAITNSTVFAGATIFDPFRQMVFTNNTQWDCDRYNGCTINRGANYAAPI